MIRPIALAAFAWLIWSPSAVEAQSSADSLIAAIRAAEDARAVTTDDLATILRGLESDDPEIQRTAVRALGRLERPDLVTAIAPMMSASSPAVRAEAANAMGQAVFNGGAELAMSPLLARLEEETDPAVGGAILQTLGRLPHANTTQFRSAEGALISILEDSRQLAPASVLGVARGLESLMRHQASTHQPSRTTIARLRELAIYGLARPGTVPNPGLRPSQSPPTTSERIRRLATAALIPAGGMDGDFLNLTLTDPDGEVRRLSMVAVRVLDDLLLATRARIVASGLRDPFASVRYEALRAYGSRLQADFGCEPIRTAAVDDNQHVTLLAIDLLGSGCATGEPTEQLLASLAAQLPEPESVGQGSWHVPSHALVSLARVSPQRAESMLVNFVTHPVWQVRMYAARAAARLSLPSRLRLLAYDEHHNVRQAAISALQQLEARGADSIYLAALEAADYHLVRTAARALSDRADASVTVPALLAALSRITAQQRETSRDARMALIEKLAHFRGEVPPDSLRPYLRDFDAVLAGRVAEILSAWSGRPQTADPVALSTPTLPTTREIEELDRTRLFLYMKGAGRRRVELRLFASEAPSNVARFVRLAREGYFDGLTFHRVVPNFVIQGGSPGANEYAGDGPYTRDEVTERQHTRGTVGISTRGRDTGDAQIFVNLVDNYRLDHNYTIVGEVVDGMDIVDLIPEGAVIERIVIR